MSEDQRAGAFEFTGDWREFAPIAFTNLLLTIVSLGIYSFWARARTRRYLWSRTRFIDDRLEWTGTGLELLIGYILAMICFFVPIGFLNLLAQGLILRGHNGLAALLFIGVYVLVFYLIGVAIFRALRYRLSRTYWHGIRGGSDEQGFGFAVQHFWRRLVGMLALGLMIPWSMTTLWNRRWGAMSYGPLKFTADARWQAVFGRYLLFYLVPIVLSALIGTIVAVFAQFGSMPRLDPANPSGGMLAAIVIGAVAFYLIFFVVLGLIAMVFYAAFFREGVGKLRLGTLGFGFDAKTIDWIKLYLGNFALVVLTLGIGYIFVVYRNWSFFIRHLDAYGDVHLDGLTQSTTREPGQGEGLLDAFDVGAF